MLHCTLIRPYRDKTFLHGLLPKMVQFIVVSFLLSIHFVFALMAALHDDVTLTTMNITTNTAHIWQSLEDYRWD